MTTRMRLTVFAFALSAAAAALIFTGLGAAQNRTATDNAFVQGDVTPVGARVAGHVVEEAVRDHQVVAAGDLLYRLDQDDYAARVREARAQLQAREAALAALVQEEALQAAQIAQAEAGVAAARATADRSRRDHLRAVSLQAGGWVSEARADQVWALRAESAADLQRALADLVAARRRLEVIRSERPQLAAARDAAAATLTLAEVDLRDTEVRAPTDGVVGERQARLGQYVRPGTVMIALVARRLWITANFKETQLAGVRDGDPVRITVDALPDAQFMGVVESLSPASGAEFALLPPDNATGNFTRIVQRVPVRIALDPGQSQAGRLKPGMSARVRLLAPRPSAS